MAILFAILRTILTVLLIILALILILILLILFVPFRYRAMGVKEPGQTEAAAVITWLLHMLTVEVRYDLGSDTGLTKDIRIFGISLFKVKAWLDERKKSKAEKAKEQRRREKREKLERMQTEDPERYERLKAEARARKLEEKRRQEEERQKLEEEARKKREEEEARLEEERIRQEEAQKAAEEETETIEVRAEIKADEKTATVSKAPKEELSVRIKRFIQKILHALYKGVVKIISTLIKMFIRLISMIWYLPGKIMKKAAGVGRQIDQFLKKLGQLSRKAGDIFDFLLDEKTQAVLALLKKQIGRLIRHIIPRKLIGYANFGLGDPYITGRILAGACVFYPLYGKTFRLEPDFDELVFNGKAELKGRIYIFYLLFIALSTILNKNTKYVINYIKSFNKEDSE